MATKAENSRYLTERSGPKKKAGANRGRRARPRSPATGKPSHRSSRLSVNRRKPANAARAFKPARGLPRR